MHTPLTLTRRDWAIGLMVGALLGLLLLGAGARVGMRIVARAIGQTPLFTIEGTVAITLLGALTGTAIGALFLLARLVLPGHRIIRLALFSAVCALIVLRGLRPLSVLNVGVFGPLFVLHAVLLHLYWCRVHVPSRLPVRPPGPKT
jgi:hypothetical protein